MAELNEVLKDGYIRGDLGFQIIHPHSPFSLTISDVGELSSHSYVFYFQIREESFSDEDLINGTTNVVNADGKNDVELTVDIDDELDGLYQVFAACDVAVDGGDPKPFWQGYLLVGDRGVVQ